jgi:hypothetical protein
MQFPRGDVKVIIGDNLAAHLASEVLDLCKKYNIRREAFTVFTFGCISKHIKECFQKVKEKIRIFGHLYFKRPCKKASYNMNLLR